MRQTPDSAALVLPDGGSVPRDARFRRDGTVLVESDFGERARRVGELDGLRSYGGQTSWTAKEERERSEVRRLFDDGWGVVVAFGSAPREARALKLERPETHDRTRFACSTTPACVRTRKPCSTARSLVSMCVLQHRARE